MKEWKKNIYIGTVMETDEDYEEKYEGRKDSIRVRRQCIRSTAITRVTVPVSTGNTGAMSLLGYFYYHGAAGRQQTGVKRHLTEQTEAQTNRCIRN